MILPVSLHDFKQLFLVDQFYVEEILKQSGNEVLETDSWSTVDAATPKHLQSQLGKPVSRTKNLKISTYVPGIISTTIYSHVTALMLEDTDTHLTILLKTLSPDQYLADTQQTYEKYEIMTADPDSNQVILRVSVKIEQLKSTWGLQTILEGIIMN